MNIDHINILLASLLGLFFGLLVAEYFYIKARTHASHVVPATIVNNSKHIVSQKVFYYLLLINLFAVDHYLKIRFPGEVYTLIIFAIVGGDFQKLATKIFRLK